ncbi:MFS transporter [Asanoa ishikariensis]|uniref:Predicted arabinose efflux permease, MFS family n=1 Tax=Asanoa ishikariensis TaxID=137265 RepID=A0A1H3NYF1_9ACTN|nr:MFS transporter [Asanoa ishikariensis]GIF68264.1 MFS transporter [Asanoa ishikariensis]SDY93733.1 Predicted arabinose efflux permease, MFS family [Asanoa ishikariensis]
MSYRAVLRTPHALRTFVAALVGRLSYGIVFVSLTVAVTGATGSYSLAGVTMALFGLGVVLVAPLRAGLIDRYGPRRVLPPLAGAYAVLLGGLAAATWRPGAPAWLLLALTASAGVCSPPLGPIMRAMWSNLLPDPAGRQRAFALDTVAEELLFVTGPLLAGVFIAIGYPALGVAVSAVLVLTGTLAMVSSPAAAAWPRPAVVAVRARVGRALFEPVFVAGGIGLGLGAANLLVVAFATGQGQTAAVAWVEAALAAGSAVGGIAYGARSWSLPQRTQLALLALALSAVLAVFGLAPGIAALAGAAALAGLFVAPALTAAYLLADKEAPPAARTRAGTWVNTAFNAGSSGGTAAVGLLIGRLPLALCFALAALPILLSAVATLAPRAPQRQRVATAVEEYASQ